MTVFLGALASGRRGTALVLVPLTVDEVVSELLLTSANACVAEKLEQAESDSSWLLSSEQKTCSGNRCAGGVVGLGPSLDNSLVALELGNVTAVVTG